jgi:hypothetical protein
MLKRLPGPFAQLIVGIVDWPFVSTEKSVVDPTNFCVSNNIHAFRRKLGIEGSSEASRPPSFNDGVETSSKRFVYPLFNEHTE